jgi:hypothetical protein
MEDYLTTEQIQGVVRAGFVLILGIGLAHVLRSLTGRMLDQRVSAQSALLGRSVLLPVSLRGRERFREPASTWASS